MRTAFVKSLCDLAAADDRIWLVSGDLGYGTLEPYLERVPDRFINAGVAEQNMIGVAAGLAMTGKIVFVYSIANFPTLRCLEQIRNDVCYHQARVHIVAVGGGFTYGAQGYTHHGVEDLAILGALPELTVLAPGDPVEARLLVPQMIDLPGPSYLRLGRAGEQVVHGGDVPDVRIGQATLVRKGTRLTFISIGAMLPVALAAADQLAAEGIDARVLSMHTLKPLDKLAVMTAVHETGAIVTVEEHTPHGGLGSRVADVLISEGVLPRFAQFAIPPGLTKTVGSQSYLRSLMGDLAQTARQLIGNGDRA
ncbi:transketolase family protein [Pseudolabrys sp. FHR47]|uniref:transketolase family protein n=1 Tax=Pseudolabrys sp. FHR47 TaxID=2562284 RepID=UPI0010BEB429|nr:transketolase C-terminal domain-containing protein [Pseudolabrys sp. FHR47]